MESLVQSVERAFSSPPQDQDQERDMEAAKQLPPRSEFVFEAYPEVKRAFIRRVYQILASQLLLTACIIYGVREHYGITNRLPADYAGVGEDENSPEWKGTVNTLSNLFWSGFLGSMASLAVLHVVARRQPLNLVVLFFFTAFESLFLSSALMFVPADLLLRALLTTVTVFVGLSLYTLESKTDFSFMRSFLGSALWILIVAGLFQIFWPMGSEMDTIFTWFGALVFCGFVVFDTWRLHFQLKPDEYVLAAVSLYLDFINLFLRILHLMSKKK